MGGISFAIFLRHKQLEYSEYSEYLDKDKICNVSNVSDVSDVSDVSNDTFTNYKLFQSHDYYLIQKFSLYTFCQIIFFWNIFKYSEFRNRLIKLIESPSFVNRFLTRWSTNKVKKKCRDSNEVKHLAKIILCIEEENSTGNYKALFSKPKLKIIQFNSDYEREHIIHKVRIYIKLFINKEIIIYLEKMERKILQVILKYHFWEIFQSFKVSEKLVILVDQHQCRMILFLKIY